MTKRHIAMLTLAATLFTPPSAALACAADLLTAHPEALRKWARGSVRPREDLHPHIEAVAGVPAAWWEEPAHA